MVGKWRASFTWVLLLLMFVSGNVLVAEKAENLTKLKKDIDDLAGIMKEGEGAQEDEQDEDAKPVARSEASKEKDSEQDAEAKAASKGKTAKSTEGSTKKSAVKKRAKKKKKKNKKKKKKKRKKNKKKKKKSKKQKKGGKSKQVGAKQERKQELVHLGGDKEPVKEKEVIPAIQGKPGTWVLVEPNSDSKLKIHRVAVGKDFNTVWGIDKENKDLYRLETTGWKLQVQSIANNIFVGPDNTVIGVDSARRASILKDGSWQPFSRERKFNRIAIVNSNEMWASYKKDEKSYEVWHYKNGSWTMAKAEGDKKAHGLYEMDALSNGAAIALGFNGDVYAKDFAKQAPQATEKPSEQELKEKSEEQAKQVKPLGSSEQTNEK